MELWTPINYVDGEVFVRQFDYRESFRFTKLQAMLVNPLDREGVEFKMIVDTFRDMIKLPVGRKIEELSIYAFRELAIVISTLSMKESKITYAFECSTESYKNPKYETLQSLINLGESKISKIPESARDNSKEYQLVTEDLRSLRGELEEIPEFIPCTTVVSGDIFYKDIGDSTGELYGVEKEFQEMKLYSLTVGHKLFVDELESRLGDVLVTTDDLEFDTEVNDLQCIDKDQIQGVVVFEPLKIAMNFIPSTDLTDDKFIEMYNKLNHMVSSDIQEISSFIKSNFIKPASTVKVHCPNCGGLYNLSISVEDFKINPG